MTAGERLIQQGFEQGFELGYQQGRLMVGLSLVTMHLGSLSIETRNWMEQAKPELRDRWVAAVLSSGRAVAFPVQLH